MRVYIRVKEWNKDHERYMWVTLGDYEVLAETDTHYQVRRGVFRKLWVCKDGEFCRCQIIREVQP